MAADGAAVLLGNLLIAIMANRYRYEEADKHSGINSNESEVMDLLVCYRDCNPVHPIYVSHL